MTDTALSKGQWTAERAHAWYDAHPWICGFNYMPSSAVNFLEMWQAETFDPESISRELAWAGEIGLNTMRTNPQYLVWKHDREGFYDRIERIMDIATANGMTTVLCPFDDCGFSGAEPQWGPQPDPIPNVHNSRAVACPGRQALQDRSKWPDFEAYFRDLISHYARDERILFWDLYNEPTSRVLFLPSGFRESDEASVPHAHALMKECFAWARDIAPCHPLTVAPWIIPFPDSDALPFQTPCEQDALKLSDIITFHAYASTERVERFLDYLESFGRPIVTTEWMARGVDSRVEDQLPMFRKRNVGALKWGLIQGRSQTWLPWPPELTGAGYEKSMKEGLWFHDLFHIDGRPYEPNEIATIRALTARDPRSGSSTGAM